jgi:hypothetical protein
MDENARRALIQWNRRIAATERNIAKYRAGRGRRFYNAACRMSRMEDEARRAYVAAGGVLPVPDWGRVPPRVGGEPADDNNGQARARAWHPRGRGILSSEFPGNLAQKNASAHTRCAQRTYGDTER